MGDKPITVCMMHTQMDSVNPSEASSDAMMLISPAQSRGARGLLGLDQSALAKLAKVHRNTVVGFESGKKEPTISSVMAIRRALEAAGIEFIAENGGGPGVRLRKAP